jgi:hypothetical protein
MKLQRFKKKLTDSLCQDMLGIYAKLVSVFPLGWQLLVADISSSRCKLKHPEKGWQIGTYSGDFKIIWQSPRVPPFPFKLCQEVPQCFLSILQRMFKILLALQKVSQTT